MQELVIGPHEAGQRLDRYLRKLLKAMPLAAIYKQLRNGSIRVDGAKVDGDFRLQPGMRLQLRLPEADVLAAKRAAAPLPQPASPPRVSEAANARPALTPRRVHLDEHMLVVAKPAGLAVHGGSGITHSVIEWLHSQRVGIRTGTFQPAPAHRIDRGTSGLLAIGLTPEALRGLVAAFRDGRVHKVYWAIVHGAPARRSGSIAAPLLERDSVDRRDPKVVVDASGRPARTDYEVVRTVRHLALLRVEPHEGRQHQIRAHLAHLGHPIVGDARYGSAADLGATFLLHAGELQLPHPVRGDRLELRAPLPATFHDMLADD